MENRQFKDYFSKDSRLYALYRPNYPHILAKMLAELAPSCARALDCGCGTGQLSVLLAEYFDEVVATDASTEQIAKAQPHQRINYKTALADNSGLPGESVDLITVAQAAHWFKLESFYEEVRRVARPDAIIALISYSVLHVDGEVNAPIQHFYYDTIMPYWPSERRHVEDEYQNLAFPFQPVETPALTMHMMWNLEQLLGYISTWSVLKQARQSLGIDPLKSLRAELVAMWGNPQQTKLVKWPLALRIGRVHPVLK
jgi:ubiquinone/menaquinone biosynthesis C-methylase UbiE